MHDRETTVIEAAESANSALADSPQRADEIFLEGPRSRFDEFITILRVMRDFLRGFRVLHFVGPCVTVFGSARVKIDNPHFIHRKGEPHYAGTLQTACPPHARIQ